MTVASSDENLAQSHGENSAALMPPLSQELLQITQLLDKPSPKVLIVVGTGVAINATGNPNASWRGLLKNGVQYLTRAQFQPQWGEKMEASLDAAFSPFDLRSVLQHAELVEQALSTPKNEAFADWLKAFFATFKALDKEKAKAPLEILRDLHDAGALLLTTNYDSLLSDMTGLPPVTWEEYDDFHRVMTRQRPGILHIHGHWQRPSSIVLGRTSYDRVVAAVRFQELFKTLWLQWSWIYVGCGNGLDDPNLGRLLEWGKQWGPSGLPHFFLGQEDKAKEISTRPDKPINLFSIGYPSHDELPRVLRSITPAARCWPFLRVDDEFSLFRVPDSNIPFPTRQEYLDGDVPTLAADAELQKRLQTHGWACVMDVASVGKTTLALRTATTLEQRRHPVFYLDLKEEILDEDDASQVTVVRRLARPGTLLVVDNIHHQPKVARQLWHQWKATPAGSRMLFVGTLIHQPVVGTPAEDLRFFKSHGTNPAIALQVTPNDLGRLAKHIYRRVGGRNCQPMPEPPVKALAEWHCNYRAALNAFSFVVMNSLEDLQKGRWSLPVSRASDWVRGNWLDGLENQELENAICLAAFGSQELEMSVQKDALPCPDQLTKLLKLGLAEEKRLGQFRQHSQISLRDPSWGGLILAAVHAAVDVERVRFDAAARHPILAVTLSVRLEREELFSERARLWESLDKERAKLGSLLAVVPLSWVTALVQQSKAAKRVDLTLFLWETIEHQVEKFAQGAWATSLTHFGSFLDVAKGHGRDTGSLWDALLGKPGEPVQQAKLVAFVEAARAISLERVGSFLDVAKWYGRDIGPLWDALLGKPGEPDHQAKVEAFVNAAWTTSLEKVGSFLDVANGHGRDTGPLWDALLGKPGEPDQRAKVEAFVNAAWAISLQNVGSFLDVAKRHRRDTGPLWDALLGKPGEPDQRAKVEAFVKAAWAISLDCVGSFLDVAKRHGRDTAPLWDALLSNPGEPDQRAKVEALVKAAWATSLENVGSFLDVAKGHGRDTTPLWDTLLGKPGEVDQPAKLEAFAKATWATSLEHVASFLNVAKHHGRDIKLLWQVLENEPDHLSRTGLAATLKELVGFAHYAPPSVLEVVLREVKPGRWNSTPHDEGMTGATWLAWHCGKANREDLASDLIGLLLRRANWRDFAPQGGGFVQACWLLWNFPSSAAGLVEAFLSEVCTEKWLQIAYTVTRSGQLAFGLRQLALHQSVERCQHFHHRSLGMRLNQELSGFETAALSEQSQIIQFLGCAGLCGWAVSKRIVASIKPGSLAQIPLRGLPHRPNADKIEDYQLQLWLGLRSFVSIRKDRLPLTSHTIDETLRLWRVNLGETAPTPGTAAHHVNQSMVAWLEACLRATPPALIPSKEPLWTLVGFPVRLDFSN